VLGVSASGRDAGCGGENWEMDLLINRKNLTLTYAN
jgi:hypothetical protein